MRRVIASLITIAAMTPMVMTWYEKETGVARRFENGNIQADVERSQGKESLDALFGTEQFTLKFAAFRKRVEKNMYEIKNYTECTVTQVGTCAAVANRRKA